MRVQKEELGILKKQAEILAQTRAAANQGQGQQTPPPLTGSQDGTPDATQSTATAEDLRTNVNGVRSGTDSAKPKAHTFQGYDVLNEVHQIMKTAFPLLIMSLEAVSDQLFFKFKASNEEETYRLIQMLLQEGLAVSALARLKRPHLIVIS